MPSFESLQLSRLTCLTNFVVYEYDLQLMKRELQNMNTCNVDRDKWICNKSGECKKKWPERWKWQLKCREHVLEVKANNLCNVDDDNSWVMERKHANI